MGVFRDNAKLVPRSVVMRHPTLVSEGRELDQGFVPYQRASRAGRIEIVLIIRLIDVRRREVLFVDYSEWVAEYLYDRRYRLGGTN